MTHRTIDRLGHKDIIVSLLRERLGNIDIDDFLHPKYEHIADPFLMHDMKTACTRIIDAITNQEKIAIYADFDADGVPGAVVLHDFFKKINYPHVVVYIPHRHDEGYGLHEHALTQLAEDGVDVVVTVDVGITATDAAAHGNALGMDMIITDHHEPKESGLPDAVAVVNPKVGDTYPDTMLCGCAVAYQVVRGLLHMLREQKSELVADIPEGWEKWLLDMVGIATLSDMVPLVGENRIFAHYGLHVLRKTRRVGLLSLYRALRLTPRFIDEQDVGFAITPRINAASRMSHPLRAFELFSAETPELAQEHVAHLETCNQQRKKQVATVMKDIHQRLRKRDLGDVVVIGKSDWNPGILGLLANKITEAYKRPAFVWTETAPDTIKGSARSYGGVNILALMEHEAEKFVQFGGHQGAGGFTLQKDAVHTLEQDLGAHVSKSIVETEDASVFDQSLDHRLVTLQLYRDLRVLAPFGVANTQPVFLLERVIIASVRMFGKGKQHIELVLERDTYPLRCIAFYRDESSFTHPPKDGDTVNVVGTINYSRFGGGTLSVHIQDVEKPNV